MSQSFQRYVNLSALVWVALLSACSPGESSPGSPSPPGTTAVTVVTLKHETVVLDRELPGRVIPYQLAEIRPQASGIIKEQLVSEGGLVEAGQPLYQLDDAVYRADYNSATASLARAEAALELARLDATRSERLVKTGAISEQVYENSMALLRQAEADVGVAEAAVATSKVMLDYTRITAPISGRVGKSSVTRGALVTANQAVPLVTVQQLDPVYVDLSRSAAEFLELRRQFESGDLSNTDDIPVTIMLEGDFRYEHRGKLLFSEVTVDPTTGSFLLRVMVPNPDTTLLPGMYVRALVSNGKRENALLVPQQGIMRDPKGNASAMVVNAEGEVEPRPVQINRAVGNKWLVDDGLSDGDQVIIEGLQKIQPGMAVEATEAAE